MVNKYNAELSTQIQKMLEDKSPEAWPDDKSFRVMFIGPDEMSAIDRVMVFWPIPTWYQVEIYFVFCVWSETLQEPIYIGYQQWNVKQFNKEFCNGLKR